jgi:hypothetical protein
MDGGLDVPAGQFDVADREATQAAVFGTLFRAGMPLAAVASAWLSAADPAMVRVIRVALG